MIPMCDGSPELRRYRSRMFKWYSFRIAELYQAKNARSYQDIFGKKRKDRENRRNDWKVFAAA